VWLLFFDRFWLSVILWGRMTSSPFVCEERHKRVHIAPMADAATKVLFNTAGVAFLACLVLVVLLRLIVTALKAREQSELRDQSSGTSSGVKHILLMRRACRALHAMSVLFLGPCLGCFVACGGFVVFDQPRTAIVAAAFIWLGVWLVLGRSVLLQYSQETLQDAALRDGRLCCANSEGCAEHASWPSPRRRKNL
jgi:hypothetical protein